MNTIKRNDIPSLLAKLIPLRQGHIYQLPPIDFWDGWTSLQDTLSGAAQSTTNHNTLIHTRRLLDRAVCALSEINMVAGSDAGHWREGPYTTALPDGSCSSDIVVAMKADNNGTTYIWSPVEMPWLDGDAFEKWPRTQK